MSAAITNPLANGFVPTPRAGWKHWFRLLSGDAQHGCILYIENETVGARRRKGTPPPEWSCPISCEEIAQFTHCSVRAIEVAIKELVHRKVLERRGPKGSSEYRIAFENWPTLPDRPMPQLVRKTETQPAQQETEEETKKTADQAGVPVYAKPQRMRPGATKPQPLPSFPKKLRLRADTDMDFDAVIRGDVLDISVFLRGEQTNSTAVYDSVSSPPSSCSDLRSLFASTVSQDDFQVFESEWLSHGVNAGVNDWAKARQRWVGLSTEERIAAVNGVRERFAAGEYPRWLPLPGNYLENKTWYRPVRKQVSSKEEERRAHYSRVIEQARERDRAEAQRSRKGNYIHDYPERY